LQKNDAAKREKQIKRWKRRALIEKLIELNRSRV
jgi:predicted GIY-YIG superfamily endonuclease